MSKNSPRSFVVRENRRREVGIFSLLFMPFLQRIKLQIRSMLIVSCFTGPKITLHSRIKWKPVDKCFIFAFEALYKIHFHFWPKVHNAIFIKGNFCNFVNLEPWTCPFGTSNLHNSQEIGTSSLQPSSKQGQACEYVLVTLLQKQESW